MAKWATFTASLVFMVRIFFVITVEVSFILESLNFVVNFDTFV